jgi:hypothetical protein
VSRRNRQIRTTFARTHALALALERDLERDLDRDLARALVLELDHALDLDHDHALDLDRALVRARNLASALAVRDRILDPALSRALRAVEEIIRLLMRVGSDALPKEGSARSAVVVSPAARRVTGFVVRLLPGGCRAVKAEEFAAELYDIAATGGPRRGQLAHALRMLATIVPLRRALADSGRRAAERG